MAKNFTSVSSSGVENRQSIQLRSKISEIREIRGKQKTSVSSSGAGNRQAIRLQKIIREFVAKKNLL